MIEVLAIVALVLGVVVVARRLGKKPAPVAAHAVSPVERWAELEVRRLLGARVDASAASIERAFAGQPEPEVAREIEAKVAGIDLAYERAVGSVEAADVRVELSFDDGHVARSTKRVPWNELPESVREEFAHSGAAHVYRPWLLPWQR